MATKRKRASTSAADETSETGSTDVDTTNGAIPIADRVFNVRVFKEVKSPKKKPRPQSRLGNWSEVLEEEGWDEKDKPIKYQVSPGAQWDAMKKYKNFVGKCQQT